MIVIETSALVAVLLSEPDADWMEARFAAGDCVLPAHCLLEASIALRRRAFPASALAAYLSELSPTLLPFDARQAHIAVEADRRYGRATAHPAGLNFGDCMSYAAAVALDAPLLFKGEDFARTDVKRVEV